MNQNFYEKLIELTAEDRVFKDEPMSKHTTFRIGGPADYLVLPTAEEIISILTLANDYEVPVTVIGNGSNLLVGDKGIRGVVLEISKAIDFIKIEEKYVTVGAGTMLARAANAAADASLGGMEFAAGIPGSMGGAVVMNAGAYGGEIKDILVSADVLTKEGKRLTLSNEELDLSYRHSCVPENEYIVLSAQLKLQDKPEEEIRALMAELRDKRIEKQPLEFPSAGSTFKRPEGYFAGKLIQDAGLRGYSVGDAQVSEKHCGFVINRGKATASDMIKLMDDVKKKVMEEFNVKLEPEVKMIGEF